MIWEDIVSKQNPFIVQVGKLTDRKNREKTGTFRFDGVKLAAEALQKNVPLMAMIFCADQADETLARILHMSQKSIPADVRMIRLSSPVFHYLSEEMAPEGVLCIAHAMPDKHRTILPDTPYPQANERLVLLESVRDPSNLGAIIRCAMALGVDRLILSEDCADIYNAKTVRASMGTLFSMAVDRTRDLPLIIETLKSHGRRVFAAALDENACRLGDFPSADGDCVVIGNEGHGLSAKVIAACDKTVYIPMAPAVESLNAAVAAALLIWEFRKR